MLGVSRTTVRSALQSLEQHGVLTRSPRRGTQVRGRLTPSMVALQRLIGFGRLLEEQGYTVAMSAQVTKISTPPREVLEALDLDDRADCYEIDRSLVASGQPAIWAIDYFPASLLSAPPRRKQLAASPFEMGELLIGGPIDHALVELVPSKATREVATRLGLKLADAYLLLKETHLSETGRVLGFSLIHVNDRLVRFRLHRGGEGL